MCVCACVAARG